MPDKLRSEDYFSLCVSHSSAEAQADTGIQMGANADWAHCARLNAGTERAGVAGIEGGDNNPGVAGTNYIHQLYQ